MRFNNILHCYNDYAVVQKKVSQTLYKYLLDNTAQREFESILELGCGTGLFTEKYYQTFKYNTLVLNDLFDSEKYLKRFSYTKFLKGDMTKLELPSSVLVLSSSTFQWIENLAGLLEKISTAETLCFSIYLKGNLLEIKNHFNLSLKYWETHNLLGILCKYYKNINYLEESIVASYNSPMDALKSLKHTGVTGAFDKVSPSLIKSFHSKNLTYKVGYFICER